jgi:hypothetical protein
MLDPPFKVELPFTGRCHDPGENVFVRRARDCQEFLEVIYFFTGIGEASGGVGEIAQRINLTVESLSVLCLKMLVQYVGSAEAYQSRIDDSPLEGLRLVGTPRDAANIFCKMQTVVLKPIWLGQAPYIGMIPLVVAELLLLQAKQIL